VQFPKLNFDLLNEADIREEIIAPLLKHLGYGSSTPNNIIREQYLTYQKLSLGKRKSSDPPLRGYADYICEAGGLVRWVIEAKPPGETLGKLALEQAWSYANHPEIHAVYFVVTNGREFKLFQTNRGPKVEALFECTYEQLEERLNALDSLLAPDAILKAHPTQLIDTGVPLGPGLRSLVRITSGGVRLIKCSPHIEALLQLQLRFQNGSIEGTDDGTLVTNLDIEFPIAAIQAINEEVGLNHMRLNTTSTLLSIDPQHPTVFESTRSILLQCGQMVLNVMNWTNVVIPENINSVIRTRATGHLVGVTFMGKYSANIFYKEVNTTVELEGEFKMQLA
jgi:Type I restriction enzyme R protein N terminus (HSDR_N)